jgi:hypothetical protein
MIFDLVKKFGDCCDVGHISAVLAPSLYDNLFLVYISPLGAECDLQYTRISGQNA